MILAVVSHANIFNSEHPLIRHVIIIEVNLQLKGRIYIIEIVLYVSNITFVFWVFFKNDTYYSSKKVPKHLALKFLLKNVQFFTF